MKNVGYAVLLINMATVSCPSLEDLLSHYGLQRKDLDLICAREVRDGIALKLQDWKMVGRCLKFPPEKLTAIEVDNKTEEQRRVALLDDWGKREGKRATYLKLAEVLHQRRRSDLVEMLCDELKKLIIQKEPTDSKLVEDISERIETLESQFDNLHQRLMSEVMENEALSGMELLRALTMLPISLRKEYESLIQQMLPALDIKATVTELFLRLSPLFRFIDYGLLDHLISRFGSLELQKDTKSYVSKIQIFMQETTVGDLMDYWPGDEQPHLNYSKLKAKFNDDPKTYTLERLNNFRRKFCSKVRLSELIFGLILLEAGESFFATWLIPTVVASDLKKAVREMDEIFYQAENVLIISLDHEVLYSKSTAVVKHYAEKEVMTKMEEVQISSKIKEESSISTHHKAPLQSTPASTTRSDHTEQLSELSLEVQDECDKDAIEEDHLEVTNDAYNKERETVQDLVSAMSEKISSLMMAMNDNPDLKKGSKELEQLKTLKYLSLKLSMATNQLLEKEFTYCRVADGVTYKPMALEEQQHRPHKTVSGQICPPESSPHYLYQAPPTGYGSTTMNTNLGNMKFRKALLRISNQLSRQDLDCIKFMCEDDVPRSKMKCVRSGTDLFNALEEHDRLSSKNLGFLVQVLTAINRAQLVNICLRDEGFVIPPSTLQVTGQISPQILQFMFRECLVKIAMGLQSTEINDLVFVFQPKLQVSPNTVFSATNLFTLLMQRQILTTSDLRALHDSLCQFQRFDLVRLINEFLAKTGQQPYDTNGQGMIIDHFGRMGNQNQTVTPVEEIGPARIHSDPSHGNLGAHLQTQYYTAQSPGVVGGGYPPHHHHQMTGFSSAGTSLPSGMYCSVSTPSSTTMDYPPAAGGGVYAQDRVQMQYAQFRPLEMMDTTAPPTGMTALKHPPPTFDLHVSEHQHSHPLQHVDPFRHHSGDVKPFGLDFNVFEPSNPGEPVSSPPSMQELEQQRLLRDLAMKQGELVRKEEEIDRLRMALEEANSDKSKVYSEKLGEAEQFKQNIRELEKMLRTKNEEVNGLIFELQHFHVQMENIQAAKPFDEKEFYRMDKNPHGICVIINNHQFYHPTDPDKAHLNRGGAEVDQKNLKLTFEYLRYKVEIYENLTHDRMTDFMLSMAQRNHANYDSFICCVLTHGEQNMVHGADSIPVSLLNMTGVMKMCKTLVNKPKMFFIQACRSDQEDKGHKLDEEEVTQRDSGGKQPPPSTHTIPQEADFFFGYATPLGNAAYRSRRHGSWYISELCKVLTTHAYTGSLSGMMRKVNDNICQAFTKEGYKQTAKFVHQLRKGVHFFHFSKVQQQQQLQHTPPPENSVATDYVYRNVTESNGLLLVGFGLDFNVFNVNKFDEPVSSPPSMQELEQQRLLQDLAMKQGELVRKEEEIERLRMVFEEANSDKSKVYSEKFREAEQFKQNIRELEKMLRTKNEEVDGLICELQHFHEKESYHMDKSPHGICVIINNHKFYHPTDPSKAHINRVEAEIDQKNLKLTFEYLRYKVETYENLTHTDMRELMLSMAQRNHADYDSFVCCILTHGEQNMVHGADSIPVSLLNLTGVMKMCKTLVNKPKMFFIQADRGDCEDEGHELAAGEAVPQGQDRSPYLHTIPQEVDFFFGCATPLGYTTCQSRHHGSWYISELCKVLTMHAYTSNLSNMMRKVNDNVCKASTKEGLKQTAEFVDRLRKEVTFFHAVSQCVTTDMEFKKGLYKISNHFSRSEVDKLKFILSDFIPHQKLEHATSAFHVFCLLENHDALLKRHDLTFFKEILNKVHKGHYIQQYLSNIHPCELPQATPHVAPDKQLTFLADLADDLTSENVRDIGLFFSGDAVKLEDVEGIQEGVLLFAKLKDAGVSLSQIKDVLSVLRRKDLTAKIDAFLASSSSFLPSGLQQGLMSLETDKGYTQLKREIQKTGDQEDHMIESMETESSYSTAYYTSLSSGSLMAIPTHSSSSSSMVTTPASTMEMDIRGRGATVLFIGGKVNKEATTEQLSVAVEERGEKLTKLQKRVEDIEQEKSHTGNTEQIKKLEALLSQKVKEVETQMEETRKLREALESRADALVYEMTSKPHGLAAIFVNGKFDRNPQAPNVLLNDRAGAQKDEEHFVSLFGFLGYTPVVYRNKSSAEMYAIMEELNKLDHSKYDSLVVCVSSHGNQRAIFGSDNVEIKRDEFYNSIMNCQSLKEKPKLFFIQACHLPVVDADAHGDGQEDEATPMTAPLHPDADVLIANASTPDNAAYISSSDGSWFVASLKKKLTDPALIYSRSLSQILQEVNHVVCQQLGRIRNQDETAIQCVEVTTRLRKGVTFFQKK